MTKLSLTAVVYIQQHNKKKGPNCSLFARNTKFAFSVKSHLISQNLIETVIFFFSSLTHFIWGGKVQGLNPLRYILIPKDISEMS